MNEGTINCLKACNKAKSSRKTSRLNGNAETAVTSLKEKKRQTNVLYALIRKPILKFGLKTTNNPQFFLNKEQMQKSD